MILNRNSLMCMYGHNQTTRNKPTTVFIGMRPHLLHFLWTGSFPLIIPNCSCQNFFRKSLLTGLIRLKIKWITLKCCQKQTVKNKQLLVCLNFLLSSDGGWKEVEKVKKVMTLFVKQSSLKLNLPRVNLNIFWNFTKIGAVI